MRRSITAGLALAFSVSLTTSTSPAQAEATPPAATLPPASVAPSASPGAPQEAALDTSISLLDPAWRDITPARGPAGREDHTWTVDGDGRFAYLFGGRDGGREFGDLWRYDLREDTWQRLSPRGKRPQPRFGHSAAWAEGHGLVIFAGQRGTDFFADLWAYEPEADAWTRLPRKGGAPRPRYGSCMVVGTDGRLWISHGFTSAGRFDDTRAYNLRSQRWASVAPDARRPGERCLHDCFTTTSGDLVLYGGQDDGAFALADLWVMGEARRWERRPDPPPMARRLYAVTEAGAQAYIFGGAGEDGRAFDDLWRVDRSTLEFERVRVDGPAPAGRYAGTLITDAEGGRLLLFGGQARSARADVWELVDRAPAVAAAADGAGPSPSPSPVP